MYTKTPTWSLVHSTRVGSKEGFDVREQLHAAHNGALLPDVALHVHNAA
jgi:hypothetical protein